MHFDQSRANGALPFRPGLKRLDDFLSPLTRGFQKTFGGQFFPVRLHFFRVAKTVHAVMAVKNGNILFKLNARQVHDDRKLRPGRIEFLPDLNRFRNSDPVGKHDPAGIGRSEFHPARKIGIGGNIDFHNE